MLCVSCMSGVPHREQDYGGFYEVGEQLGIHAESIRNWMRQGEIDGGKRDGVTTSERYASGGARA